MSDSRELLELAAKAAGIKIDKSEFNGGGRGNTGFDILGNAVLDWHDGVTWNPLTDDGDALRLAVKLRIIFGALESNAIWARQEFGSKVFRESNERDGIQDEYAATRRAIVRAAAEIGRAK